MFKSAVLKGYTNERRAYTCGQIGIICYLSYVSKEIALIIEPKKYSQIKTKISEYLNGNETMLSFGGVGLRSRHCKICLL